MQPHIKDIFHHLRSSGPCVIENSIVTLGLRESVITLTSMLVSLLVDIAMSMTVIVRVVFVVVHTLSLCVDTYLTGTPPTGLIPMRTQTKLVTHLELILHQM